MKNRLSSKFDVVIDLTSMLDVIFIILIVIMCRQQLNKNQVQSDLEQAQIQQAELEQQIQELEQNQTALQTHIDAIENIDKEVAFVTLSVGYDADNRKSRTIQLLRGKEEICIFKLMPGKENEVYEKDFIPAIKSYLEKYGKMPVLLTLDDTNILYRDQERMTEILNDMKKTYSNLYINNQEIQ